jgi:hypothetical protein
MMLGATVLILPDPVEQSPMSPLCAWHDRLRIVSAFEALPSETFTA